MKKSMHLEYLKKGDLVSIISTAKYIKKKEYETALGYIKSKGLNLFPIKKTIFSREGMFSGTDKKRQKALQEVLDNKQIKAVFFARGGYGSIRILDALSFEKFIEHPKWLIGFSDITVFLSHVTRHYNCPVLHSPMPYNFKLSSKKTLTILFNLLFGKLTTIKTSSNKYNRKGIATGKIIGGNLSILCSLLGSETFPITKGNILIIEDIGEYLYSIDRMMYSLKRAGVFKNLAGLIVGKFSKTADNNPKFGQNLNQIILTILKEYTFPLCFNFPVGHIKNNTPIIFYKKASLMIDQYTELRYL